MQEKNNSKQIIIITVVVLAVVGAGIFYWFLGRSPEASEPISSIPLELNTPMATEPPSDDTPIDSEATTIPVSENEEPLLNLPEETTLNLFEIIPERSEVRFILDEDLRGERLTVVGVSNQIAGQLAFNLGDLSQTQVGTMLINARTFATPIERRDNAIRNFILDTEEYEYITFEPTEIVGLPANTEIGEEISFQIVGDLTIRDITNSVTLDVTATPIDTEVSGTAKTTITREDYNLQIPSVPNVANVEEEVELEIDFVAEMISSATITEDTPEEVPTIEAEEIPVTLGLYEIVPEQSEVRFKLDEDLRGERIEVIGVSNQVAGQLAISLADLSQTQVGEISINARTFETPIRMRDNAIRNFILDTEAYEFITFEPTEIVGLPATAEIGEEISFHIVGNLTIRDITNSVTFDVIAVATSDTQLTGSATTIVTLEAYELQIPNVPNVANVEEEVELEIDFVAQMTE